MPDFPTGLPDIPNANGSNPLSTFHTSEAHSTATNRMIANILALATKLGYGSSSPGGSAALLKRSATGQSAWGALVNADVDAAAAIDPLKLGSAMYVAVTDNTNQSIANSTSTNVTWNTEVEDPHGMHSAGSATFTIPSGGAGLWIAMGGIQWQAGGTGARFADVLLAGASQGSGAYNALGEATYLSVVAVFRASASQSVTLSAYQNSGGSLSIIGATAPSYFRLLRIGT